MLPKEDDNRFSVPSKTTVADENSRQITETASYKVSEAEAQNLAERMLSQDLQNLPNLEEFKIKEDKIQVPTEEVKKEAEIERKEAGFQAKIEESKINPMPNPVIIGN